jgi:formylglycine-generating enzyme required for sulfatase activity
MKRITRIQQPFFRLLLCAVSVLALSCEQGPGHPVAPETDGTYTPLGDTAPAETPPGFVWVRGGTLGGSENYRAAFVYPEGASFAGEEGIQYGAFVSGRVVTIPSFFIAQYEVTWQRWKEVYDWAVSPARGEDAYVFANPGQNQGAQRPVTAINWRDAIVWCNAYSEIAELEPVYRDGSDNVLKDSRNAASCDNAKMDKDKNGFRLPTEVEREFAARGGDPGEDDWMYMYAGSNNANEVAWYHGNSPYQTRAVGTAGNGDTGANRLGIYDLSGNVQEWCWDWMNYAVDVTPTTDADGAPYSSTPPLANQKAFNGGGVGSNPTMSCVAYRWGYAPDYTNNCVGFRVVCKP